MDTRALQVLTMPSNSEIVPDALCGLRMNRKRSLLAALAHDTQGIIPTIDMKVPDLQASDLRSAKPDLQPHRQNCPITQPNHFVLTRCIQNRPRLLLGKCQRQ